MGVYVGHFSFRLATSLSRDTVSWRDTSEGRAQEVWPNKTTGPRAAAGGGLVTAAAGKTAGGPDCLQIMMPASPVCVSQLFSGRCGAGWDSARGGTVTVEYGRRTRLGWAALA